MNETRPYVEIKFNIYLFRFFGRGEFWEKAPHGQWQTINAALVPGEVLRIAAEHSHPYPDASAAQFP